MINSHSGAMGMRCGACLSHIVACFLSLPSGEPTSKPTVGGSEIVKLRGCGTVGLQDCGAWAGLRACGPGAMALWGQGCMYAKALLRFSFRRRGGGGGVWHKASVSIWLPLAVPIGLSPLLILTLCGSERVLVVPTEPLDDLSCLTTPGVGRPGDGAVARAIDQAWGGGGGFPPAPRPPLNRLKTWV